MEIVAYSPEAEPETEWFLYDTQNEEIIAFTQFQLDVFRFIEDTYGEESVRLDELQDAATSFGFNEDEATEIPETVYEIQEIFRELDTIDRVDDVNRVTITNDGTVKINTEGLAWLETNDKERAKYYEDIVAIDQDYIDELRDLLVEVGELDLKDLVKEIKADNDELDDEQILEVSLALVDRALGPTEKEWRLVQILEAGEQAEKIVVLRDEIWVSKTQITDRLGNEIEINELERAVIRTLHNQQGLTHKALKNQLKGDFPGLASKEISAAITRLNMIEELLDTTTSRRGSRFYKPGERVKV